MLNENAACDNQELVVDEAGWLQSGDTRKTRDALQAGNCRARDAPAIPTTMIQDWLIRTFIRFRSRHGDKLHSQRTKET